MYSIEKNVQELNWILNNYNAKKDGIMCAIKNLENLLWTKQYDKTKYIFINSKKYSINELLNEIKEVLKIYFFWK